MVASSIIYAYSALGVQAVIPIILGAFASVKVSDIRNTHSQGFVSETCF
jgi:hypothetical protein